MAQALEARLVIERLMDEDPARFIIVAGDFNAEDHETPLRILIGANDDTGNGSLAMRALTALDRSLPGDRRFRVVHHGRAKMPDHILSNWSTLDYFQNIEIHNENLADELVSFGRLRQEPGSPHAPLVAEFNMGD